MKKFLKTLCRICAFTTAVIVLYFVIAFFGNPISYLLAKKSASNFMEENFGDSHFQISHVNHDFKTGGYYAYVSSPITQDSYFTIYFDDWGNYRYDTYEDILTKQTTFSRLAKQYWDLTRANAADIANRFDCSIYFGDLQDANSREVFSYTNKNGETVEYTLDKDYGLDRSGLELDKEYDVYEIGRNCGSICLYIHDPEVTVERAAELLLEVKTYLDGCNVPFHAINFNLCEPRNEEGQFVGEQIALFDFLYIDIFEEGLVERIQESWDQTQWHYAIQDKEKAIYIDK